MAEQRILLHVRNRGSKPLTIWLEPWGTESVVAPGTAVHVMAQGPAEQPFEVDHADDGITFYGWPGAKVAVVPV